ncbi:UDP-N-acetylglucosamine 1-carboxyvinyltransferase [Patescibacteria group bacterium]|nr:UDP-N-acetylglucosamine 1-carboxyvinyltransferase [Patescibacteria group bacterium]MBU1931668.1 UDP-N-acetylglucosamine 1-carboxyvinyltransferase [Patescibacteria group bacterium]
MKFKIQGGQPLYGAIRLGGAKNASFKLMIAALLAQGESRLLNFSRINDVEVTKKIITSLGGGIRSAGERTLFINSSGLKSYTIPEKLAQQSRASTMFVGPLLARFKQAVLPLPGGDKIGKRPLDRHFDGLKALGAKVEFFNGFFKVTCSRLQGTKFTFAKTSHTGTETLIMAAVLAQGTTVINNAALEPEVDDLINFLNQMGAKIKRQPGRIIEITGVNKLKPTIYKIIPDRNEAVSYAIAALVTQGDVVVENADPNCLASFLDLLDKAGAGFEIGNYGIRFYYKQPLKAVALVTQPHPGFMTDWQPLWAVVASQSSGLSTIIEAVHTSRFQYVPDLVKMGAKIEFFQPTPNDPKTFYNFNLTDDRPEFQHGIKIIGPTKLTAIKAQVPDLRAGATLVLAALSAQGETVLENISHIDRGYEDLDGRLRQLGAKIERVE